MKYLNKFEKFNENLDVEKYCQTYLRDSEFTYKVENNQIFISLGEGKPKFNYQEIKKYLSPLVTFLDRDSGVEQIIFNESLSNRTSKTTRHRCSVKEFMNDTNDATECEYLREVVIVLQ
jgi:hypothetical protein